MAHLQEAHIRVLMIDEWMRYMERGEGDWIRFDISVWDGNFLILERQGKMLAYLQHHPHEYQHRWHVINRLETRPYFRRRGYARRLVEEIHNIHHPIKIIARGVQASAASFWLSLAFFPDGYGAEREQNVHYNDGNFVWGER